MTIEIPQSFWLYFVFFALLALEGLFCLLATTAFAAVAISVEFCVLIGVFMSGLLGSDERIIADDPHPREYSARVCKFVMPARSKRASRNRVGDSCGVWPGSPPRAWISSLRPCRGFPGYPRPGLA